jgi:hypothetical protein
MGPSCQPVPPPDHRQSLLSTPFNGQGIAVEEAMRPRSRYPLHETKTPLQLLIRLRRRMSGLAAGERVSPELYIRLDPRVFGRAPSRSSAPQQTLRGYLDQHLLVPGPDQHDRQARPQREISICDARRPTRPFVHVGDQEEKPAAVMRRMAGSASRSIRV